MHITTSAEVQTWSRHRVMADVQGIVREDVFYKKHYGLINKNKLISH